MSVLMRAISSSMPLKRISGLHNTIQAHQQICSPVKPAGNFHIRTFAPSWENLHGVVIRLEHQYLTSPVRGAVHAFAAQQHVASRGREALQGK